MSCSQHNKLNGRQSNYGLHDVSAIYPHWALYDT